MELLERVFMVLREQIIAEARSWIGTPYQHQGRLKGVASDCVGFIICVPRALGLFAPDFDINGYSRHPEPAVMRGFLDQYLDRVWPAEPLPGDVLWLKPNRLPQHLAILTREDTIIHAIDAQRGVREHRLNMPIAGVWRYRGLDD